MQAYGKRIALAVTAGLALALAGAAAPLGAAESSCPSAGPLSTSTFGAALSAIVAKVSGSGPERPDYIPGSVWHALNGKQQDEVLNELSKELSGLRVGYRDDRKAAATQERLDNLRRRVGVLDRLERDPKMQERRIFDTKDGKRVPYTRGPKPLSQILDEETAKVQPGLGAKYGKKYAEAIRTAIEKDPKRFAETLGKLAGGDYAGTLDHAAELGASAFGTIVSDALGEMGYADSKVVWDEAVKRAGTARTVFQALARGDHGTAWETIKDEYKKEVKDRSRAAAAGVINWVMDTGGGPPSAFGMTPGDAYLKLIDAEIALIEWSKDYLRRHSTISDGECIRQYNDAYARFGNADAAYESIDVCMATSRYSAFFEFGNQARSIGLDETAAIKAFLEAARKGESNTRTPLEWIAARVEARQKEMQAQMLPELTRVEAVMANVAEVVAQMTDNRLNDLAAAKLNERQWDQIEKEVRDLEQRLEAVLAEIQTDLARIRTNSDAVQAACRDYDGQKSVARGLLEEASGLSAESYRIWDRLLAVDTSVCGPDPAAAAATETAARRAEIRSRLAGLSGALDEAVRKTCAAPEAIRGAASKEAARTILDDALAAGREVERLAGELRRTAGELAALGGDAAAEAAAARTRQRQDTLAALNALAGEIDALDGRFTALKGRFDPVRQQMARARQRIVALVPVTYDLNNKVRACLRPLANAPVAEEPRRLLDELGERSGSDAYCRDEVVRSWYERDPDPSAGPSGIVRTTPWSRRSVELGHPPARLRARLAELRGQCPAGEAGAPMPAPDAAESAAAEKDALADADLGPGFMQRCVAEALTAFNDTWLKPDKVAGRATCSPDENAAMRARLQKAVADGAEGAPAELDAFDRTAAQVRTAHARYEAARGAYASGDLGTAESSLRQALANAQGAGVCADLVSRVETGLDRVSRLTSAIAAADAAVAACDLAAMSEWKGRLGGVSNPAAARAVQRVSAAEGECRKKEQERQVAEADQRCAASFGEFVRASPETAGNERPTCVCRDGYRWNEDRTGCVRAPSEQELAAARNANCRQQYGAGYSAGPVNRSGQYYCLPNKATADAWCRRNNSPDYYAGRVNSTGGFNCYLSDAAQQRIAIASCRQQYGAAFIRVVKRGGQYYCEFNSHDQRSSAAAAAAIGAAIQGLIGGGNRPTNCHHRPNVSTQHCGSN